MTQKFTESSWSVFGGLRFILAILVVICHLFWFAPIPRVLEMITLLGGKAAVLSFLLLSGVSIGHSYVTQPSGYFRRRFLRIYPLYFAAIIFTEICVLMLGSPYKTSGGLILINSGWQTPLANLFFMQGILSNTISYNDPLWSLGPEVIYYLLAPLFTKLNLELLLILFSVSTISFAYYPKGWYFGYSALRYIWPWLIGFIFATRSKLFLTFILLAVGTGVIIFIGSDASTLLSWLTFTATAISIFFVSRSSFHLPNWCKSILNFLGELSYPIYLFHVPLFLAWTYYFPKTNTWILILCVLSSTIPINYLFDNWLKTIFWKPVVKNMISRVKMHTVQVRRSGWRI